MWNEEHYVLPMVDDIKEDLYPEYEKPVDNVEENPQERSLGEDVLNESDTPVESEGNISMYEASLQEDVDRVMSTNSAQKKGPDIDASFRRSVHYAKLPRYYW